MSFSNNVPDVVKAMLSSVVVSFGEDVISLAM